MMGEKNLVMQELLDEMLLRHPKIVQTEGCMGGQPRLDGTRMRITDWLVNLAANDWSPSEMIANWGSGSDYELEDVKDVLRYAYDLVDVIWCKANGREYESDMEKV